MKAWATPVAVVVAAAIGGLAFANLYLAPAPASAQLAVEQRLMCPQCEAVRLDVCDRPICADMKADIARRLLAGESQDTIVRSYRQSYGSSVLSNNQPTGAAPLVPWAALAVGLVALAWAGLRRRAR